MPEEYEVGGVGVFDACVDDEGGYGVEDGSDGVGGGGVFFSDLEHGVGLGFSCVDWCGCVLVGAEVRG